jgi:hypothetical protein
MQRTLWAGPERTARTLYTLYQERSCAPLLQPGPPD